MALTYLILQAEEKAARPFYQDKVVAAGFITVRVAIYDHAGFGFVLVPVFTYSRAGDPAFSRTFE